MRFPRARSLFSVSRRLIYSPAPALLPAKREEDEAGRTGTRDTRTHVCAASGSRGKKGAFSPRVTRATPEFVAPDWHERGPREASPRSPDTRQIPAAFCTYKNSVRASICIFKQTHRRRRCPLLKCFRGNIIMFGSFPIAHALIRRKCMSIVTSMMATIIGGMYIQRLPIVPTLTPFGHLIYQR